MSVINSRPYFVALVCYPTGNNPWAIKGWAQSRKSLRSDYFHPVKGVPDAFHASFALQATDAVSAAREGEALCARLNAA
jgi:hypothetical protein